MQFEGKRESNERAERLVNKKSASLTAALRHY
jgi:hypothetical protein